MRVDRDTLKARMAAFPDLCRRYGMKVTHQRTEIYRELARTEEHPDAESIYRKVKRRIPAISLDTVYRALRQFEENGIIGRVSAVKDRARFDANNDRHHHFICTRCGKVRDFYNTECDAISPSRDIASFGTVTSVHVEMRGVCTQCARKSRSSR